MIEELLTIKNIDVYFVFGIILLFGILESISGFLKNSNRKKGDWIQEILSFLVLGNLVKPIIVLLMFGLGNYFFPQYRLALASLPFVGLFAAYILIDDVLQYWYHRTAHETPFLWKLHRPHHQAEEMGFFVSYRNALLYYLLMPNIWWVALVLFLGGGKVVALGLILKQLIIIGSHSQLKWDKPFYQYAALRPIIKILERIIITPAFHHSHHGTSRLDTASEPNGNFGNMFSLWDQLIWDSNLPEQLPKRIRFTTKNKRSLDGFLFLPFC